MKQLAGKKPLILIVEVEHQVGDTVWLEMKRELGEDYEVCVVGTVGDAIDVYDRYKLRIPVMTFESEVPSGQCFLTATDLLHYVQEDVEFHGTLIASPCFREEELARSMSNTCQWNGCLIPAIKKILADV